MAGWEEAILKGLVSIDAGLSLNPKERLCLFYSGTYRRYFGQKLMKVGRRDDGREQLDRALSDLKKASKLWPENENIASDIEEVQRSLR